jgi:toxin ParE1/3/4
MKLPVIVRHVAEQEYLRAIEWYEDQRPGLGRRLESAVEATLVLISEQPLRYAISDRKTREAPVEEFPYSVYYIPRPHYIDVLAIIHQSRNPDEWQSRI